MPSLRRAAFRSRAKSRDAYGDHEDVEHE
uniref:Uncharacterized protein n=1 Tax=blood disease bacterium R229 TaxID=741978 RepID=G2ZNL0_9RALS|nr:conserved hypothetical protein [blood disease bacterium R229]